MTDFGNLNYGIIETRHIILRDYIERHEARILDVAYVDGHHPSVKLNGLQLSSTYAPELEASQQAATLPLTCEITIYGSGLGFLPQELLKRTDLKKLNVKIINLDLFIVALTFRDQRDWLSDHRVQITLARDDEEILTPFFCSPAELRTIEPECCNIKECLESDINQRFISREFAKLKPKLTERIETNLLINSAGRLDQFFGSVPDGIALLLGAGPSLSSNRDHITRFFEHKTGPIIAVDAATKFLHENRVIPDFVVCIDHEYPLDKLFFYDNADVTLVFSPQIRPEIVNAWQGRRFLFMSPTGLLEQYITSEHVQLMSGGSVIHPAAELAVKLGVKNIQMSGVDFAFPDGKTHSGWKNGDLYTVDLNATKEVEDVSGLGVPTTQNMLGYKVELERLISRNPEVVFHNLSPIGAKIRNCAQTRGTLT